MPTLNLGWVLFQDFKLGSPDERGITEDPEVLRWGPIRQQCLSIRGAG
ncbi:MAG: hypothetical protein RJB06_1854 [Pseudomonadota bacterium]